MTFPRRFVLGAMCALFGWTAPAAFAAPRGPTVSRQLVFRSSPGRNAFVRYAGLTAFRISAARSLPTLSHPLAGPVRFPVVLQRLDWSQLLAPTASSACGAARAPVIIATLPRTPFAGTDCSARGITDADGAVPPPLLVAGHDKNALYGRAYSPSADRP